jgi:hypothetical protein
MDGVLLANRHGVQCWINCEIFDREMLIKFLSLKLGKVLLKLEVAKAAGGQKRLCFEILNFMGTISCYPHSNVFI